MKKCERCGARPKAEYGLLDFCAGCSGDLCPKCMANGCCGEKPAVSGSNADAEYEEELAEMEPCACDCSPCTEGHHALPGCCKAGA